MHRRHSHHVRTALLAAALGALAIATLPTAHAQPPALQEARVHRDAAGNLHVSSELNQTVFVNGVDVVGELVSLRATVVQLQRLAAAPKLFSGSAQTKITASDAVSRDEFGYAVAVSGTTMVIGAPFKNGRAGAAYVFVLSSGLWVEQQKLTASDGAASDLFAWSVAIDGATIAIGATSHDLGAVTDVGAVYVFMRTGTTWTEQQKLTASDAAFQDALGRSVGLSGDIIVSGAPGSNVHGSNSGAAYVFTRAGTTWTQQQRLLPADHFPNDHFGAAVGVSGDTVVIGSNRDDDDGSESGSVYVFHTTNNGASWAHQAKLTASDAAAFDNFGLVVGISGDTVVVGAEEKADAGANSGAAYVFHRSNTTWAQEAKLAPAGGVAADDFFGNSVAVSGDIVAVGAWQADENATALDTGAVYVYQRFQAAWAQQARLVSPNIAPDNRFGWAVAIDGPTLAVGVRRDDDAGTSSGSTYIF